MKRRKTLRPNCSQAAEPSRKKFLAGVVGCCALAAVVVLGLWLNGSKLADKPQPVGTNILQGTVATVAPTTESGFEKLVGRWLRRDGGYVLEVRSVDTGGKMEAAYLNPRPIHVARAEASRDGMATEVFVELRDINYPGSTYTLIYEPARDQLKGIYFQAALKQQFEVFFERLK